MPEDPRAYLVYQKTDRGTFPYHPAGAKPVEDLDQLDGTFHRYNRGPEGLELWVIKGLTKADRHTLSGDRRIARASQRGGTLYDIDYDGTIVAANHYVE